MTATSLTPTRSRGLSEPTTVAQLGVERGLLLDIVLKTLFYRGRMTRVELSDAMKISGSALQQLIEALGRDGLVAVIGAEGHGPANYLYALSQKGIGRAEAALGRSGYVGPAPVPLSDYVQQVHAHTADAALTRQQAERALAPLVLSRDTVARIGRAAAARKSILVHGPSGNGKTTAARAIGEAIGGTVHVPHAIEMAGQIVHVYDPSKHEPSNDGPADGAGAPHRRLDRRWVRIRRPVIWAGGELTRDSLELIYDAHTRVYEAPLQLKANGGTLIIDDFGRQQIPAVALLNRWIGALEAGVDHLTLHTGQTIEVPFNALALFSTNLSPHQLADDAFLRRIRYKVELPNPAPADFHRIFQRACERAGIDYSHATVTHLLDRWYVPHHRELRGCHPRDLIEAVVDAAAYDGSTPSLTPDAIDEVCAAYFLDPMNASE